MINIWYAGSTAKIHKPDDSPFQNSLDIEKAISHATGRSIRGGGGHDDHLHHGGMRPAIVQVGDFSVFYRAIFIRENGVSNYGTEIGARRPHQDHGVRLHRRPDAAPPRHRGRRPNHVLPHQTLRRNPRRSVVNLTFLHINNQISESKAEHMLRIHTKKESKAKP